MKSLAWIIPLVILVLIIIMRLSIIPYKIYTQQQDTINDLQAKLNKTELELIIPRLQIKPIDIEERIDSIGITIDVLNYGDYTARNIIVDIKFGSSQWRIGLTKVVGVSFMDKLLAEKEDKLISKILSEIEEKRLKEQLENFYNRPTWNELAPGKSIELHMHDWNKDFLSNQRYFFMSGGRSTPVSPEETPSYQESQGWKEQIDNMESGKPIIILLRAIWENEVGKKYDRIIEYQLICTKVGTGRSYNFLPTGVVIEDS